MKKIIAIAKWEFIEKVKTKAFIISLVLTPLFIFALSVLPTLLIDQEDTSPKPVGILDSSGLYFNEITKKLDNYQLSNQQPNYITSNLFKPGITIEEMKQKADKFVLENTLDGYMFISAVNDDSVSIEYRSKNIGSMRDLRRFEDAINETRLLFRLEKKGADPSLIKLLSSKIELRPVKLDVSGEEKDVNFISIFLVSLVFMMMLILMILYSGGMLIRSLVEEKSNRIIEILLSSCTANDLLWGKIIGLSLLGLSQIVVWLLIGISLFGTIAIQVDAFSNIGPMLVYFILGYVFYTALFVGIGSIATTEQEAQQITGYLSMILVLPVVIMMPAIQNPELYYVKILSYIPFTTPNVMFLRLNSSPIPLWEHFLAISIMLVTIFITVFISSKIFKVGILSYGKRPTMKELFQWLKEK